MKTRQRKRRRPFLERCDGNSCRLINMISGQIIYAFCNRRRFCRRCAEYYRYCVARRLNTVEWQAHVLLTLKPGEDSPTKANLRHQSQAWQILVGLLRKEYPGFYYAWIREITEAARLHLHVLWSIPWISQDYLRSMTTQAGFGYAEVRSIRKPGAKPQMAAINYVTENLGKIAEDPDGAWLEGTRRHQISAPVKKKERGARVWVPFVKVG